MREIAEADWKLLRELKAVALERLCDRILTEVGALSEGSSSAHQRFLAAHERMDAGNADVGVIFDDLRRSNAAHRLGFMRAHGLITDAEFSRFTEETRKIAGLVAESRATILREARKR